MLSAYIITFGVDLKNADFKEDIHRLHCSKIVVNFEVSSSHISVNCTQSPARIIVVKL